MNKLVEHFNTQYFASHYSSDVKNLLTTVNEIDLAGARICRDVMKHIISAAYNGVQVHDTEDYEREAYFVETQKRRELQQITKITSSLPIPASVDDVIKVIKSLDASKIYGLREGRSISNQAFAFLVQAARPEICINLGSYVGEVLALVYDNLFPNPHKWDEFYVLVGTTFVVKRPTLGEYNNFINESIAVPTDFGNECLFKLPEWEHCIDRVTRLFEKSLRPRNRKIRDYLQT